MAEYVIENINGVPYFDLELFMSISRQSRVDGEMYDLMTGYWEKLGGQLRIRRIIVGNDVYYLVWLEEPAEEMVDQAWEKSESEGFTVASLAQTMLMAVIQELAPHVAENGCAPIPNPTAALLDALDELGLPWQDSATLPRQYAMLTTEKPSGGCGGCHLAESCPSAKA